MFSVRLLALALSAISQNLPSTSREAGPEEDALDALMRNVTLGHTGPGFLRLYGRDPGKKTLARLTLVYPKLLAASKSEWVVVPGCKSGGFDRQKHTRHNDLVPCY
jgi:hypothetical protein